MLTFRVVIIAAMSVVVHCQRGSFAGTKPIGFPELLNRTTTTVDPLGNRFGEGGSTTERLPVEANGDRDLVNRISKLPLDQQPFWYLNWKALEEQRKNPQTYPQRPSQFAQTPNFNAASSSTGTLNSNSATLNSNTGTLNSNSASLKGAANSNSGGIKLEVPSVGNRNSGIETDSNVIGTKKQMNPGVHVSGIAHYPHNRYGM